MKRMDGIKSAALVWADSEKHIHQTAILAEDRSWPNVHIKSGRLFYRRASTHLEEMDFADDLWQQPRTRIIGRWPVLPGLLALLLAMTAWGQIIETNLFPELNLAVPDDNAFGVEDRQIVASEIAELTGIKVHLQIVGNYNGDIYAYLRHTGTVTTNTHLAVLLNRVGRSDTNNYGYSDDGFDVLLSDLAENDIHVYRDLVKPAAGSPLTGEWQPDARFVDPFEVTTSSARWAYLSNLNGMAAAGEWTLFVAVLDPGGTNTLVRWGLEFTGKTCPQVSWAPPDSLIYGDRLTTNELNASANVPGTFNYVPRLGTVLAAGNAQTLTMTFQPDDTNQFVSIRTNVTVDIGPRELVVTAFDTNKTYGEALLINDGQFSVVGLLTNESIVSITLASLGTAADAPVGSYLITPSSIVGNLNTNNYLIRYVAGTLVVNRASLTAQVDSAWRFYGQPNPPFTVIYSGFANGEDVSVLQGTLVNFCYATTNSPAGDYVVTATGQSALNYSLVYHAGTLSVRPAPLLITAQDDSRLYGQANPPFAVTFTGLVNGDDSNAFTGVLLLDCSATPASPVASYPIVPSGLIASNYNIVFSNAVLTVDPASSACALLSSTNMAAPGESLTFSAHVSLEPASEVVPTGEVTFRIFKSGMYGLCLGTALMLIAFHAQPAAPRRGLHWLARMGRLSYELYLSHMFIVLGAVALYRELLGKSQDWTFAVYLPAVALCVALALVLERLVPRLPINAAPASSNAQLAGSGAVEAGAADSA